MRYLLIALAIVSASCTTHTSGPSDPPKTPAGGISEESGRPASLSSVDQARAAFPDAKRRFLRGLPEGSELRVKAVVENLEGQRAETILVVDRIEDGQITGRWLEGLARDIPWFSEDVYRVAEDDILDWVIMRPDGAMEGNFGWWHLGELFALERRGTGKTCDLAKQAAISVRWREAKEHCNAMGARVCRSEMIWIPTMVWRPEACQWDETDQLHQVAGVRNYGCCAQAPNL